MTARGHREIQLTKGHVALVDAADFDWLSQWKWCAGFGCNRVYALRSNGRRAQVRMHRAIVGAGAGQFVDHVNGDTLDNRRANLRVCTRAENARNRQQGCSTAPFKGVTARPRGHFDARIGFEGRSYFLGRFPSAEAAARAYDRAALQYHGEFARLNFPEAA